jgi:hypothetical protein
MSTIEPYGGEAVVDTIRAEIQKTEPGPRKRAFHAFVLAALGSIPWVGGFLSAVATFKFDESEVKGDSLRTQWLEEHHKKLLVLRTTLEGITEQFERLGETIDERLESEEYLTVVRRAFRAWDQADTEDKASPDSKSSSKCGRHAHLFGRYFAPVSRLVGNVSRGSLCSDKGDLSESGFDPL